MRIRLISLLCISAGALTSQTKVDYGTQIRGVPVYTDVTPVTNSLVQFCSGAGTGTLAITRTWSSMLTQSVNCNLQFTGGKFQPSAPVSAVTQVVTITGNILAPSTQQIFDTSLGGSILFTQGNIPAPLYSGWFGTSVGTTGGATDTFYAPMTAAIASLPAVSGGNGTTVGQIVIPCSGPSGTYLTGPSTQYPSGGTLQFSSRSRIRGGCPENTSISPTSSFAPVAGGTYMASCINPNGSGAPNDAFACDLEDLNFLASANGNGYLGGLSLGVSTNTLIRNVGVTTGGVAFNVGGTGTANADNVEFDNDSCTLTPEIGSPWPVCIQEPVSGGFSIAHSHKFINLAIISQSTGTVGAQVPTINFGTGNANMSADTIKCEQIQFCVAIGGFNSNFDLGTIIAGCDAVGTNCPQQSWPNVVMISPSASNIHVKVVQRGFAATVVFADPRFASASLSLNYSTIDPYGCVQQVTTGGTSSSAQSLTWGGDGASYGSCTSSVTTSDGAAVWTNEGAAVLCTSGPGITNAPCIGYGGTTSNTDATEYSAECWSSGCESGNMANGNVTRNYQGTFQAAAFKSGYLSMFGNGTSASPASVVRSINSAANSGAQCQQIGFSTGANSNSSFAIQFGNSTCGSLVNAFDVGLANGGSFSGYSVLIDQGGTLGTAFGGNTLFLAGKFTSLLGTNIITPTTPASSSAACTTGTFTADANYYYFCTATNTWKRAALSTF